MSTNRIRLEGIAPRAWEHPSDRAASSVLRSIPGLNELAKTIGSLTSDRALRLMWLGSSLRAGPLQFPLVHSALEEACRVLDVSPVPELFVAPGLGFNAMAVGFERPFVVVTADLAKSLPEDELLAVLGHELAHIKAGHMLYRTVLWILTHISLQLVGASELVRLPIVAALKDWERKSELSCDRAGQLVCQNPAAAKRALIRVSYPAHADQIDEAEILRQAKDYDATPDLADSLYKLLGVLEQSHPLLVVRLAELDRWGSSDLYTRILSGTYDRDDTPPDAAADARDAWTEFKSDLDRSADAGSQLLSKAVKDAERLLSDLLRP